MTHPDEREDREFDELLREVGPDVPRPELPEPVRARLLASIGAADPRREGEPGRARGRTWWMAIPGAALAAVLAVTCILLWVRVGRIETQLTTSRWEADETLQLLMNARRTQPSIPVPADLEGLTRSDLVLITFDHALCPIARVCTPGFRQMATRHRGEPMRFITFDVTGLNRARVAEEIDAAGMDYALLGPPGAETGVVKVLDATHKRVLCSAPGERGLEQAEQLLARVSG